MMRAALLATALAAPASADSDAFVEANLLGIFYHELGHAVIDIEALPIFAQEEDAADVFSILLIDTFWEPDAAEELAWYASTGFWAEAIFRGEGGETIAWWDVHSPDERRFYNTVCLFYGADPDARTDFAEELDLPEERADSCPEEFDLAIESWGPVIDEMLERGPGKTLMFRASEDNLTAQLIGEEVTALNSELSLSQPIDVRVESCGEANAFYDPADPAIIMCTEFEDHLRAIAETLN